MKRISTFLPVAFCFLLLSSHGSPSMAQSEEDFKYMRGSLCMMMVEHPQLEFNSEIEQVFSKMEIPNRFNDHDLGVRIVRFANDRDQLKNLTIFCQEKQLAKKLVSKWFDRNKQTGAFDTELLRERGHYSATKIDVRQASQQTRGMAILEDMGENLISHTYWVVNDIQYVNRANFAQGLKGTLVGLAGVAGTVGSLAGTVSGSSTTVDDMALANATDKALVLMDKIKGFRVKITSHLFRLEWNDSVANTFYSEYYTENPGEEASKVEGFKANTDLFTLEYLGEVTTTSAKSTILKKMSNEDVIRKVCTRALDKNLAELQHQFADFRIKAPLVSTSPLKAYVGMKEDITPQSRYEVLQPEQDKRGVTRYKRVGVIKPVEGKIWDNQFMADEEDTEASTLDATYFEKVSGDDFMPGMLIREIK